VFGERELMVDNQYLSLFDVDQGQMVIISEGVPHSSRDHQFILHPLAPIPSLWIMMPVNAADQTLLLADLKSLVPDYEPQIPADALALLDAYEDDSLMAFVSLLLDDDETSVRIDLQELILLNPENGKAKSVPQKLTVDGSGSGFELDSQISRLTFEEGLVGCPDWTSFLLYKGGNIAPFAMLISLVQGHCSLPVIDPWLIDSTYNPTLTEAQQEELGIEGDDELQWFTILNIERDLTNATANLLGPLAINVRTGHGLQTVLSNSGYSASYPVGKGI
jgi:flagellar assembly factor FliW